ncbi:MAG: class I SAM-dependent methyltransferase [Pseudobdellovibrionaceae bacterium]
MAIDNSTIVKAYKRYAEYYNFYFGRIFHPGRKTAVDLAEQKNGTQILEVGVGTGLSLPLYLSEVSVTGIDISPQMLEQAKALVKNQSLGHVKDLKIMDAEDMTFADNTFDCVIAMYVATVVPNPAKFVEEVRRVCKPGGQMIFLNHFNDPTTTFGKAARLLGPFSKQLGWRPNLTLEQFLQETNLEVKKKISVNFADLWTILLSENKKTDKS